MARDLDSFVTTMTLLLGLGLLASSYLDCRQEARIEALEQSQKSATVSRPAVLDATREAMEVEP